MNLLAMIYLTAVSYGVDPRTALAVAYTESRFNPAAVGTKGDTGLFQVRHQFVDESQDELLDPETNAVVAMKLLKRAKRRCNGLGPAWIVCYNRGETGAKRLENPELDDYYLRVSLVEMCLRPYSYKQLLKGKGKECFK